jgi:peptide chain release factor subunit 1
MVSKNTIVEERVKHLSELSETDYPFITLYLSVNSHENLFEQAEKNRIFIKDAFRNNMDKIKEENNKDKLTSFQNDEEKIIDYLDNSVITQAHGVAIFACDKLGIFETFQSLMPFENSFSVNSIPHLKQIAYQTEEFENTLVIMVDSKYSTIFSLKLGGFVFREINITDIVHKYHKQGGWSQTRYQRHIKDQIQKHYEETAKVAVELFDREQFENVILIGQENEIKNFMPHFPERMDIKIISTNSLYKRDDMNKIMETVFNDLRKTEKERELKVVRNMIDMAQSGGRETLGIQDTIQLAKEGRVDKLAAVKNFSFEGWKCGECFYVEKNQYLAGCPKCNGNVKRTDLVEEIVRLTLRNGGKVDLVEDEAAEELKKYESIGASLRY